MSGTIGRTRAGQELDKHMTVYKDPHLRRRLHRFLSHQEKWFLATQGEDWKRGVLLLAHRALIKQRFPQKRLAFLRKHLYAYTESIFGETYKPETKRQLDLKAKREATRGQKAKDQFIYDVSTAMLTAAGLVSLCVVLGRLF